jgi:hypothetical protein
MADHQTQREDPAAARAEDRRGTGLERMQQRRRVVRLLLGRGRLPTGRDGTAAVAAPVIGDDRELVGQTSANASKWPPSPVAPMINSTGGPVPRTSW